VSAIRCSGRVISLHNEHSIRVCYAFVFCVARVIKTLQRADFCPRVCALYPKD
jgi:hypothetical protein